jgi:hypothetical protein
MWLKFFTKTPILLLVFLMGCIGIFSVDETAPTRNYDIVFQTERDGFENLGFYSLTTGGSTELKIERGLTSPYILEEGDLVALWNNANVNPRGVAGYLTILRQSAPEVMENSGDPRMNIGNITNQRKNTQGLFCKKDDFFSGLIRPYRNKLILNSISGNALNIVDPNECKIESELINLSDVGISKENHQRIQGFSVNTDSNILVLSTEDRNLETYNLKRVNLSTNEVMDFKKFGINPSVSPDGKEIAYLSEDGIRIMGIDGNELKKVTDDYPWMFGSGFPKPEWSPDGLQLIYHRCPGKVKELHDCTNYGNYSVFLYDIRTGVERKLFDNGVNPSWIKH